MKELGASQKGDFPTPNGVVIPDKLYFKIGEVCEITGVKQHVLRYWESEFRILSPQRANSRQRLYRRVDVENILRIKRLLKEEGFTISGAKKMLAGGQVEVEGSSKAPAIREATSDLPPASSVPKPRTTNVFSGIKKELLSLKKILDG